MGKSFQPVDKHSSRVHLMTTGDPDVNTSYLAYILHLLGYVEGIKPIRADQI